MCLDSSRTLASFKQHNKLSDTAVKQELQVFSPRTAVNILGFGCDEGAYELALGQHLVDRGLAKEVKVYGYDPYATRSKDITYLTPQQLRDSHAPSFDLIIARWVLHHVYQGDRWDDFLCCLNKAQTDALALIVEHGFLDGNYSVEDKQLYELFNALFDVVANIGLRPQYFFTKDNRVKDDFYVKYLEKGEFDFFTNHNKRLVTPPKVYEVGPRFPSQTLCVMK